MTKLNQKEWARFQAFHARLVESFNDPRRQFEHTWRGDYRAIQWVYRWMREQLADRKGR